MTEHTGLRERKKQATREAIGAAALRLALERGPENVRVDDIVTATGISPRTFNNYFSGREEAIWASSVDRAVGFVAAVRARPADEPVDVALRVVLLELGTANETAKEQIQQIAASPTMRAEYLRGLGRVEDHLTRIVAERIGADPVHDLGPRLIAGAYALALRVATAHWLGAEGNPPLTAILTEALDRVAPIVRAC